MKEAIKKKLALFFVIVIPVLGIADLTLMALNLKSKFETNEGIETYSQLTDYGVKLKVVEIDGHEYLLYYYSPGFGSLCHKADCKYCERKK